MQTRNGQRDAQRQALIAATWAQNPAAPGHENGTSSPPQQFQSSPARMQPFLLHQLTELELEDESDQEEQANAKVNTFARCLKAPPGTESFGYDLNESEQHVDYLTRKGRLSDRASDVICRTGTMRWLMLCVIGFGTGLVAIAVDTGIEQMFELRHFVNDAVYTTGCGVVKQYLAWVSLAVLLSAVAGWLVCYVQVLAAGSGIPEIKCYLNGIDFPSVVGLKTLCAKAIGIVFSVSAGLPCGKEGPMIHSGAIIGAVVSKLNVGRTIQPYVMTQEIRDLVAAGAASGVAAAFGAPLGSVLFAIEEGSSHMNPAIMTRLFVASSMAVLTARFFLGPITSNLPWGILGWRVPVSFGRFSNLDYHITEMLIFALMAVFGGLFGAGFNCLNKKLSLWRQRYVGPTGHRRFLEVLLVTFTISSLQFLIPVTSGASTLKLEELSHTQALFWESGSGAMKKLFHQEQDFDLRYVWVFAALNLAASCWTYGIGVPSGLFVPSLLTGAAFGRIVGQFLKNNAELGMTWAHPGIYALIGACSMLAGTARITISLAMILMETCGDAEFGLPIFLAVMIAKWTGDYFNKGIYDLHIIELKKVPLLETLPERNMIAMQVRDVMARDVVTFELVETVEKLVDVLADCNHHGFPVLYPGTRRIAGMMTQSVLRRILELGELHDLFHDDGSSRLYVGVEPIPWNDMRPDMPYKCKTPHEVRGLVQKHLGKRVNLRPYVNRNGLTVAKFASVWSCFLLFRQLGLRHLPVIGRSGDLVGLITRKDLIVCEEDSEDEEDHDVDHDEVVDLDEEQPAGEEDSLAICADPNDDNDEDDDAASPMQELSGRSSNLEGSNSLSRSSTRALEPALRAMGGAGGM